MKLRERLDLSLFLALLVGFLALFPSRETPRRYEEVDLLGTIRPEVHAVAGSWRREDSALVTSSIPWGRLQIPYVPPEEYDLKVSALRTAGLDSLNLGLSTGRRQFMVVLDGETGSASWIDQIDPKAAGSGRSRHAGKLFVSPETPIDLEISVRKTGVAVKSSGRTILDWTADPASASLLDAWRVRDSRALFVGSFETEFRIRRLSVVPISGEGAPLR